jgi:hypothetical protein
MRACGIEFVVSPMLAALLATPVSLSRCLHIEWHAATPVNITHFGMA